MTMTVGEHLKSIAVEGQARYMERRRGGGRPKVHVFVLGPRGGDASRAYKFLDSCRCGHVHLIADGGATLAVCGGGCDRHDYEEVRRNSDGSLPLRERPLSNDTREMYYRGKLRSRTTGATLAEFSRVTRHAGEVRRALEAERARMGIPEDVVHVDVETVPIGTYERVWDGDGFVLTRRYYSDAFRSDACVQVSYEADGLVLTWGRFDGGERQVKVETEHLVLTAGVGAFHDDEAMVFGATPLSTAIGDATFVSREDLLKVGP